ncbi:hypothetical protein [Bombilactobacillus thymidiniphilus]|uniref:DUF1310 family protein n=1 Tax=Bombilactobacillus thymidiniphilus TaxID=2923363 RepID=A0ABY4PFE3_9LACO|nr:hypothetical protein [Bombilactobacillus thymidiniphilus]UQS84246.1 hypothetical protein MOO47_03605 [Bombilactobacillus thymidiniphilus]
MGRWERLREWLNRNPKSKKHLKCLLVFLIIILGIVLAIHVHHVKVQQSIDNEINSHKKEIEHFVKVHDEHHRIKNVTVDYKSSKYSPAGGLMVEAYVNHDKKLNYCVDLIYYDQEDKHGKYHLVLDSGSGTMSTELYNLLGEKIIGN